MKSTPEGARDYLVPSRVHPGQFYALPQSPQTYKQILMVAGMDRYVQITKCFRDEDLRADRQPEFTQIDVEMTFATEEMIYGLVEGLVAQIWRDTRGIEISTPFAADALRGGDSPLRLRQARLALRHGDRRRQRCRSRARTSRSSSPSSRTAARSSRSASRARASAGASRWTSSTKTSSASRSAPAACSTPSSRRTAPTSRSPSRTRCSAATRCRPSSKPSSAKAGDLVLVLAGPQPKVFEQMGDLRLHMARETGLIPEGADGPWEFLWVTDFPLLEWDEESGRFHAMHHPFTAPSNEDLGKLADDPGAVRSQAYDLVLNGSEIGGGSIRIHRSDVQSRMFELLGISEDEATAPLRLPARRPQVRRPSARRHRPRPRPAGRCC